MHKCFKIFSSFSTTINLSVVIRKKCCNEDSPSRQDILLCITKCYKKNNRFIMQIYLVCVLEGLFCMNLGFIMIIRLKLWQDIVTWWDQCNPCIWLYMNGSWNQEFFCMTHHIHIRKNIFYWVYIAYSQHGFTFKRICAILFVMRVNFSIKLLK